MGKLDQKKQENVIYWSIDQCKKAHLAYFRDTKAWFRLNLHFGEYLKPGFVLDKVKKRGEKLTKEQEFGPDTWQNTLLLDNKVKKKGEKGLISSISKFGGILENRKHLRNTGFGWNPVKKWEIWPKKARKCDLLKHWSMQKSTFGIF